MSCLNSIRRLLLQSKWRRLNSHNFTTIGNPSNYSLFPIDKVKVGRYTYGDLFVIPYGETDGFLSIGSFCSIAKGVKFLLGGNHEMGHLLSYPIKSRIYKRSGCDSLSKGDIIICDDVWIGDGATILSGVTIGQGAVIGANCVVSKDVEPYEVVVGNPMRVVKKRFGDDIIDNLLKIDFDKIDKSFIDRELKNLYSNLTLELAIRYGEELGR